MDIIQLRGITDSSAARQDNIPIGARWQVRHAVLRFDYVCSSALQRESSWLVVLVNDLPVGQIPLEPRAPKGRAEIEIDPVGLKSGYNRLVFSVHQHTRVGECESPTSPDLWTRVDLTTAELELDVAPKVVPAELSAIGRIILDSRDILSNAVHIVIPEITTAYLRRAGLLAAGAALRRKYQPTLISLSDRPAAGLDNLVIGPKAFLDTLGPIRPEKVSDAVLGITSIPLLPEDSAAGEPSGALMPIVYMSGATDAELDRAALAFSFLSTPFPDASNVVVKEISEPRVSLYGVRGSMPAAQDYSFAALGFKATTFRGAKPSPGELLFRLPSDLHIEPNQPLMLSVNLAYGSGMRKDSALNIEVNGKFMAAIPLNNPNGGFYNGYQVQVLSSLLVPGRNTVRFVPVLISPASGPCVPLPEGNLVVTLFDDSVITLPRYGHWIRMPSLQAFMTDGFPFGQWPDLRETSVCLCGDSYAEAAAAVNLVALTAQKTGYPPTGLTWHIPGHTIPRRNLLVVGTRSALETNQMGADLSDLFPMSTLGGWVSHPQLKRPAGVKSTAGDWLTPIQAWFGRPSVSLPKAPITDSADQHLVSPLIPARWGYLFECAHPQDNSRTLLVLASETTQDLVFAVHRLWKPETQAAIHEGAVAFRLDGNSHAVQPYQVGKVYYLGAVGPVPAVSYFINTFPLRALLLVLGLLIICSLSTYILLRHIRQRRLPDA